MTYANILISLFIVLFCFAARSQVTIEQLRFQRSTIKIKDNVIQVELAQNAHEIQRGLMFRRELATNHGMLFIYSEERILSFWMKNTLIDLDIGFFDKNRKLVDIQKMISTPGIADRQLKSYKSKKNAQYALEMNAGWFAKNRIKIGDKFEWAKSR
jgi:uncharacterized membrane protein (UPF0127 family)